MNIDELINIAHEYYRSGNLHDAARMFEEVLEIQPQNTEALYYFGLICYTFGNYDLAIEHLKEVLQLNPNLADTYVTMGNALQKKGQLNEAMSYYKKALEINPDSAEVYQGLGDTFRDQQKPKEAIDCYRKVILIDPERVLVYNKLAILLKDVGKLHEAEDNLKKAIEKEQNCHVYYSNFLFLMNHNPQHDAQIIFHEHLLFAKKFAEPLSRSISPYNNKRSINRRLKIGYVSPDFKLHPVAYFIEPILIEHTREHFEVFCYSDVPSPDDTTKRIQSHTDKWRSIFGVSDEKVAELIREDEIDILVDLSGHASAIRILLFARKPAPVQVSWIGYLATTGLSTIDYRIVDRYTDPPEMTEKFYTEKLVRLPESFLCYLPHKNCPKVSGLPALETGHITFGSFNKIMKVSEEVISLWSKILMGIPNSRLIMKTLSFSNEMSRQYGIDMFKQRGITEERIDLLLPDPPPKHLESYGLVDIGLDTFPFNGLTTTCEAMWMGVPVVTLAGTAYHTRSGVSLLSNVGLPQLIAKTNDEYISIAINLANDLKRLKFIREQLRDMMKCSPLCDSKRFIAHLEMSYREMWKRWCQFERSII
jgi:protein O-GlcNAc transferase